MIRALAATAAAALLAAAAQAQPAPTAPGDGPIDVSADRGEVFDREGRVIYQGDVNILRGAARLRADTVEIFFDRREGGGFGPIRRMVAVGDVYYVTPAEIARGDEGVYDFDAGTIQLTGSVVLTQGCNVSTGESLFADIDGGQARLVGGGQGESRRVRSVFFEDPQEGTDRVPAPGECPQPAIPGDGPEPFVPAQGR